MKNIIIVSLVFFYLTLNASIKDKFYRLDNTIVDDLLQTQYNNHSNEHLTLCFYIGEMTQDGQLQKNVMHDLNIKYNNKKQIDKDYRETVLGFTIEKDKKKYGIINGYGVNLESYNEDIWNEDLWDEKLKRIPQDILSFAQFQNLKTPDNHDAFLDVLNKQITYRTFLWFVSCITIYKKNNIDGTKQNTYFVIPRIGMDTFGGGLTYGVAQKNVIDWIYYTTFVDTINQFQTNLSNLNIHIRFSLFDKHKDKDYKKKLNDIIGCSVLPRIQKNVKIAETTESMYSQEFIEAIKKENTCAAASNNPSNDIVQNNQSSPEPFFIFLNAGNIYSKIFYGLGIDSAAGRAFPNATKQLNAALIKYFANYKYYSAHIDIKGDKNNQNSSLAAFIYIGAISLMTQKEMPQNSEDEMYLYIKHDLALLYDETQRNKAGQHYNHTIPLIAINHERNHYGMIHAFHINAYSVNNNNQDMPKKPDDKEKRQRNIETHIDLWIEGCKTLSKHNQKNHINKINFVIPPISKKDKDEIDADYYDAFFNYINEDNNTKLSDNNIHIVFSIDDKDIRENIKNIKNIKNMNITFSTQQNDPEKLIKNYIDEKKEDTEITIFLILSNTISQLQLPYQALFPDATKKINNILKGLIATMIPQKIQEAAVEGAEPSASEIEKTMNEIVENNRKEEKKRKDWQSDKISNRAFDDTYKTLNQGANKRTLKKRPWQKILKQVVKAIICTIGYVQQRKLKQPAEERARTIRHVCITVGLSALGIIIYYAYQYLKKTALYDTYIKTKFYQKAVLK